MIHIQAIKKYKESLKRGDVSFVDFLTDQPISTVNNLGKDQEVTDALSFKNLIDKACETDENSVSTYGIFEKINHAISNEDSRKEVDKAMKEVDQYVRSKEGSSKIEDLEKHSIMDAFCVESWKDLTDNMQQDVTLLDVIKNITIILLNVKKSAYAHDEESTSTYESNETDPLAVNLDEIDMEFETNLLNAKKSADTHDEESTSTYESDETDPLAVNINEIDDDLEFANGIKFKNIDDILESIEQSRNQKKETKKTTKQPIEPTHSNQLVTNKNNDKER